MSPAPETSIVSLVHERVTSWLAAQKWTFAKSMPTIPHEWTSKSKTDPAAMAAFVEAVDHIRNHGEPRTHKGRKYSYLVHEGYAYWTMSPSTAAWIINRAREFESFDAIADDYDRMFADPGATAEDRQLGDLLKRLAITGNWSNCTVLDIGCGTGLFLRLTNLGPEHYTGLDPSGRMLMHAQAEFPHHRFVQLPMEAYFPQVPFDVVVSTWGSLNYVLPVKLPRVKDLIKPGGRFFLMFHAPGYNPEVDIRSGKKFHHYTYGREMLEELFGVKAVPFAFGKYLILTNLDTGIDKLMAMASAITAGFGGVASDGTVVDRREHPEALPIPENPHLNTPAPQPVE